MDFSEEEKRQEEQKFNNIVLDMQKRYFDDNDEFVLVRIHEYGEGKSLTSGALGIKEPFTIIRAINFLLNNFKEHTGMENEYILRIVNFMLNKKKKEELDIPGYFNSRGEFTREYINGQLEKLEKTEFSSQEKKDEKLLKFLEEALPSHYKNVIDFVKKLMEKPFEKDAIKKR